MRIEGEDEVSLSKSRDIPAGVDDSPYACIAVVDWKIEVPAECRKSRIERETFWALSSIDEHLSAVTYA